LKNLPRAEKEALATRFHTSVATLEKAYDELDARFNADLRNAYIAYDQRQKDLLKDFEVSASKVSAELGCENQCLTECLHGHVHIQCF